MLDMLDDASDPDQMTTDYQKLITVDKVNLTFGPFSTLLTKPASVITHRYGYALPEGSGGGPSVFQQGLNNVFDVSLPVANNLSASRNGYSPCPPGSARSRRVRHPGRSVHAASGGPCQAVT